MQDIKEIIAKLASSVPQDTKRNADAKRKFNSETDELVEAFIKIGKCTAKSYNDNFYPSLLSEFELDDKAAARISRVIQQNAMTLDHCANVLEAVAPYCTLWTTDGFLKRLHSAFTLYQPVDGWDMKG